VTALAGPIGPSKEKTLNTAQKFQLTDADLDSLGEELDALRATFVADLGESDVAYMRKVIKSQRALEVAGRALLFAGFLPPAWLAGTAALSAAKILDNMEIGHNIMHGQYDWTHDPALSSKTFDWDTSCPAESWQFTHNYMHHTYTATSATPSCGSRRTSGGRRSRSETRSTPRYWR